MPTYASMKNKPTICITMGDPSGIGPEVTLKSLKSPQVKNSATFIIIGDNRYRKPDVDCGKASFEYLETAVDFLKKKKADALVTAPVNKEMINKAGIKFIGHTEYLAEKFKVKKFAMMLVGGGLRVTLVTRHLALKEAICSLNKKEIVKAIELTAEGLKKYFKIKTPKIVVCGLNPHCGEGGILGKEEENIILPAVKTIRRKIKGIIGPMAADSAFRKAYEGKFDAVICMYHDQGLIPLKMLAQFEGVNITLGLPFIRTSPTHGTAYDIAAKNKADHRSMLEAIKLAIKMCRQ